MYTLARYTLQHLLHGMGFARAHHKSDRAIGRSDHVGPPSTLAFEYFASEYYWPCGRYVCQLTPRENGAGVRARLHARGPAIRFPP